MRFGSVQFFKVLIKTVLAVVFFAPLIVAVIFGVFLVNKNKQIDELKTENISLNAAVDVFVGARAGTAEDFYTIFSKSGVSYNDFLALIHKDKKLSAEEIYNALSGAGVSDKDIVTIAASKKMINGEEFYEIMTKNGVSDKDLVTAVINKNGSSPESLNSLLKECGLNDAEIAAIAGVKYQDPTSSTPGDPSDSAPSDSGGSSDSAPSDSGDSSDSAPSDSGGSSDSTPSEPDSQSDSSSDSSGSGSDDPEKPSYMSKYPDMYVTAPTDYVREQKTVYLTFDDGPSDNVYTIIEYILKKRGIKATFFVTPTQNTNVAKKLKYIADNGHAIGIHSATHDYEKIYESVDAFLDDFYEAWMIVYNATGIKTPIFRFPGGSNTTYNAETRDEIIAEMTRRGFRFYDWNVQSNDILGHTWAQMYHTILNGVENQNRAIVLFHDRSNGGVNVLDDIIGALQNKGYKFDKINDNTMPIQFVGPFS